MKKTLVAFVFFFSWTLSVHAQTVNSSQLSITPTYPGPNEVVKVHLESYSSNLNQLEVTWTLNGKVQKKAIGDRDFSFTTGALGTISTVTASTAEFTKTVKIQPSDLELVWQTNTYVPPFYKGKALDGRQSTLQFVAIPSFFNSSGVALDPKTLVYTWSRNGSVLGNQSGYGKQTFSTGSGVLAKPFTVEVEVSTPDGSQKTKKGLEVANIQPEVVLYENHPLYGVMYDRALPQEFSLVSKEISIVAAPYFFEAAQKNDVNLFYDWKMNGSPIEAPENPATLTLRRPDTNVAGTATISLAIKHLTNILQFANSSAKINFDI